MTVTPFEADPQLIELSLRIGVHVRTRRQARGLSRRMLSKISGVSERYLAQLETGNGNVTVGILHRLSLVFGCSVEDLIGGGTKPNLEKSHRLALLGLFLLDRLPLLRLLHRVHLRQCVALLALVASFELLIFQLKKR